MKISVYIDGFNLYYGCLKDTPYRWLDVNHLCKLLFPHDEIVKIKYFTAPIKIRENDPDHDRPNRQQIYLRALRTLQNVEIIEGAFLSHNVSMKLIKGAGYAKVIKSEEKGTDVNIATHLIHDAHSGVFEKAVVISNDSDLVTPIRVVKEEIDFPVTVISPYERNSIQLKDVATDVKKIRQGVLRVSQFAYDLQDATGTFSMPDKWKDNNMKKHVLIFAKQNKDIFNMIRDGQKTVETRAGGPKYAHIPAGDILVFSCDGEKCERTITKVTHFKTMQALLKAYRPEQIHPGITTAEGMIKMWESFPHYKERIAESGLLAFELE